MHLLQRKGRTTNIFLLIDGPFGHAKHRRGHLASDLKLGGKNS